MAVNLQPHTPAVVIVPPPSQGGRYRLEFRAEAEPLACGHRSAQALLWLIFLEADRETGREVSETICSECDPGRFARVRAWAEALA